MSDKVKDIIRQKIAQNQMKSVKGLDSVVDEVSKLQKPLILEKNTPAMDAFLSVAKLNRFNAEIKQVVIDKKIIEVIINKEIYLTEGDLKEVISANIKFMHLYLKNNAMYFEFSNSFYDAYLKRLGR